jgi:hypothetical protein
MGIACWFIISFRRKSMEATRGMPPSAFVASPSAVAAVGKPACACAMVAAARFCWDPTLAILLKNISNSAWLGVRPNRHRLPTMSSTLAVRSNPPLAFRSIFLPEQLSSVCSTAVFFSLGFTGALSGATTVHAARGPHSP